MQPLPNNQLGFPAGQNIGFAAAGVAGMAGVRASWADLWARGLEIYNQLAYQIGEERARKRMLEMGYRRNAIGGWEPDPADPRWWPSSTPAPNVAPRNYGPTPAESIPSYGSGTAPYFSKEWKSITLRTTLGPTGAGPGGTMATLAGLSQGTDISTRVGRKVVWKHWIINFRWSLNCVNGGVPGENYQPHLMVWIIYDKQSNGALPGVDDILDPISFTTTDNTLRPLNLNNRNRFVVLKKILIDPRTSNNRGTNSLGTAGSFYTDGCSFNGFYVNCETIYKGTGNAVTDIASGNIFFFCVTSRNESFIELVARGRFVDT